MTKEINIELFEKNARMYNKKNLNRSFSTIPQRESEYVNIRPLGASSKFVLEAVVDKESVSELQKYFKKKGFVILGSNNYYHIENMVNDYNANKNLYTSIKDRMEAIEKDVALMKESSKDFEEVENDDAKFYFLPYNENITNLCQFIEEEKKGILKLCKKSDITVVLNIIPYTGMLRGFFGFNYLDAETKEETVIDFSSNIVVNVDFKERLGVYAASLLLSGVCKDAEDLELMNCHIYADNLKYE